MDINIIGACQTLGCGRDGVQYGPDSLRENNLLNKLSQQQNLSIIDTGNIYNDDQIISTPNTKLKNYEKIADFCNRLSLAVCESLNNNKFPLVIGGDHSLGIGSVCGAAKAIGKDDLCVIWIDAHTDINTQDTSPTGNIHGMTLASTLGLGNNHLSSICGSGAKIKAENIIYIASRDIDPGEAEIIKKNNISVFHMQDIIRDGLGVTLQNIKRRLDNLSASSIYLSIDIDVIDPNIAPGTGVPVPNGINKDMLYQFIDVIANTGKIKGAELVEVNPTIDDDDNKTSILAIEIIEYLLMRICDNYTSEALD